MLNHSVETQSAISLLPVSATGWRKIHLWAKGNAEHLAVYMPGYHELRREQAAIKWWSLIMEAERSGNYRAWTVRDEDGRMAGLIEVGEISPHRMTGTIACALSAFHEGQDIMRRAIEQVLKQTFTGPAPLNRITAYIAISNHRSIRMFNRLGFIEEGLLRKAEKVRGSYQDMLVLGMTKDDWEKKGGGG